MHCKKISWMWWLRPVALWTKSPGVSERSRVSYEEGDLGGQCLPVLGANDLNCSTAWQCCLSFGITGWPLSWSGGLLVAYVNASVIIFHLLNIYLVILNYLQFKLNVSLVLNWRTLYVNTVYYLLINLFLYLLICWLFIVFLFTFCLILFIFSLFVFITIVRALTSTLLVLLNERDYLALIQIEF